MLQGESPRMWGMKKVIVIPVVVGALGAISAGLEKYFAAIGIEMKVEHVQKNSPIGNSKDYETGTWMLKTPPKKQHHKYQYHCARLCETFDNRLLSALTELAGTNNNKRSDRITNEHNNISHKPLLSYEHNAHIFALCNIFKTTHISFLNTYLSNFVNQ